MIVVVGGIKGGSGKTTIATNLTVMLSKVVKKVLLVDADEQKSSMAWAQHRDTETIPTAWSTIHLSGKEVHSQLKRLRESFDDIIVDVGGRDVTSQSSALLAADIFLVPFQPRSLDIWTIEDVNTLIERIAVLNPKLKSYAVINRADSVGTDNQDAIKIISDYSNIHCLPISIGQRKSFANAITFGLSVIEMKPQDKKAIQEMLNLYNAIYQ